MVFRQHTNIILASSSPRRKELLKQLVNSFSIFVSNFDEQSKYIRPHKRVMDIAKGKAELVTIKDNDLVISADTTVYMQGKYYGKPKNNKDAKAILLQLSGKTHCVYSGVCIKTKSKMVTFYEKSKVTFRTLDEEVIDNYITTAKPFDKAGGYGIQDKILVQSYKGSYTNIVGLPLEKLSTELKKLIMI